MNSYSFSVALFSFGVLLIAILALVKRKDKIAMRFALFSIAVCGWGILYAVWTSQHYDAHLTLKLIRFSEVFAVFIPVTWLHYVLDFVGKREPFKNYLKFNYGLAFILLLFCPSPLFFKGVHEIPVFQYYKSPGPVFYIFLLTFLVLVPQAFYYLVSAYRKAPDTLEKKQLQFLIIGWFIAFFGGTSSFLPVFKISNYYFLFYLMPFYPVCLGISLVQYGLFNVQEVADAFQREKMAALGIMAASLNHEIRNPLFIAKGRMESYLDATERGAFENEAERQIKAEEAIAVASAQLTRAVDIMQRFSDFARPAHSIKFKEKTNLSEMTRNVLELVSNEFQLQSIKVSRHIPEDLELYIHKRQLEEILFNLILNACHSMETQGGDLKVAASQNGRLKIEISDTGSGIAKEDQRFIFDPFYSTKGDKGTGLGLFITKRLVEQNNGCISVKSKLGQGTTFVLEFKR